MNSKTNTVSKADETFEINITDRKTSFAVSFVDYQPKTVTVGSDEGSVMVTLLKSAANRLNNTRYIDSKGAKGWTGYGRA